MGGQTGQRRPLISFFALTLGLSLLVFWGPIAVLKIPTANIVDGAVGPVWAIVLVMIGGFVPSLTGIALTAVYEGRAGLRRLFKSAVAVRIGWHWYGFVLLMLGALAVLQVLLYRVVGGPFDSGQFIRQLPALAPLLFLGPVSEELGWRGFALPRLLGRFSPLTATLILGLLWSVWHLPLFYMPGTSQFEYGLPFISFLISVTSVSILYTYVYVRSGGSVFSAIFIHWIHTYVLQVVGSSIQRNELYNRLEFVPALLIGLICAGLLMRYRARR